MGENANDPDDAASAATHYAPLPALVSSARPAGDVSITAVGAVASSDEPAPSNLPSSAPRQLLAGRYELHGLLGAGGMGSVYKARDRELDELVALKLLRRELVDAPGMLERFRREVKLARRVTHANVARVFDIGEHGADHFLTMEFVDGESLANVVARAGALPIGRAVEVACAVLAGLGAAHAAGIVHRDLKPDNVLVAKDGRVVVTDFGIARVAQGEASQTFGAFVGTPAYMAPEQVEGAADVDARADVYAFGAMLFELVTGKRPWGGDAPIAVAAARLLNPPPDPRTHKADLPAALAEAVIKCMARRREDRFQDAGAIASELSLLTMPATSSTVRVSSFPGVSPSSSAPSTTRAVTPKPAAEAVDRRTVAVLPFRNTGKPEDDYLADELTDDLIDSLSMTQGLKVRPRGSVQKYRGAPGDPCDFGRELGVQAVVEGSARKAGGAVRISARVLSVADGFQLWAKRFDRPEQDVLAINDEVARAVAGALTVDASKQQRLAPRDPAAVDLYLRARHEYRKFWPEPVKVAIGLYEEALALTPDDPVILSGAALARARLAFFSGEGFKEALAIAERAVAIAPELAEAHLALANVVFQLGDTAGALRELKGAIALGPGLAEAHAALGRILVEIGEVEIGTRHLKAAIDIDSHVPLAASALSRVYALAGEWERVPDLLRVSAITDGSTGAVTMSARFAIWRRDAVAARVLLGEMDKIGRYAPVPVAMLELVAENKIPDFEQIIAGSALANPAKVSSATRSAAFRRDTFFAQLTAEACAFTDRAEGALTAIERAIESGLIDRLWLERCPVFDESLRATPRFVAAVERMRARSAELFAAYKSA